MRRAAVTCALALCAAGSAEGTLPPLPPAASAAARAAPGAAGAAARRLQTASITLAAPAATDKLDLPPGATATFLL